MALRSVLKNLIPEQVLEVRRRALRSRARRANKSKSAAEVFSAIYANNQWGGTKGELCSGSGSEGEAAEKYVTAVTAFIKEQGIKSVVDVGCGDFRLGRQIAESVEDYVGLDVVPEVVERNRRQFASTGTRFELIDAAEDTLPAGELVLVRQVLQHLSNAQIQRIISKLSSFKYAIVTEHYPAGAFVPNLDKVHGADVRTYDNSAVVLDATPFNVRPLETMLKVTSPDGESIQTFLFMGTAVPT